MKPRTPSKSPTLLAAAALSAALATGCARTIDFTVMRPAAIDLQPTGGTVSVGWIQANGRREAAADVRSDLQERIANNLNPNIHLLLDGGGVVVDGAIIEDGYDEHSETVSQTCTKTVDDGVDSNGVSQSHQESYDCSYDVTVGVGVSRIQLRVLESGGDHRVLFTDVYTRSDSVTSPSSSDVTRLMHDLRDASVAQFAKVILPWRERVSERFKDCEGDDRCKKGFERAKAGDLPGAEALFTEVIGPFAAGGAVPVKQRKQIAEALYDRGVTRAHQGRYAEAVADLEQAIALQPKRAKWPSELARVQELSRDHEALRAQGAVP